MTTFLSPIDLSQLELRNVRLQNLATAPATPVLGQVYYDTALATARVCIGVGPSVWATTDATKATGIPLAALAVDPLARANHTGTQLAGTISNFAAVVQATRLDQFAVPTATVSLNGQVISNVGTGSLGTDAANRGYVDLQVQLSAAGISSKAPVRAVATANVVTRSGVATVDGVALAVGDRVLLTAQTATAENGVYVVQAGAWIRPPPANDNDELTSGALWLVTEGTIGTATQWRLNTNGAITPGTTPVSIVQFGAGASYSAGNGLSLVGGAFSVLPAPSGGILVSPAGVAVDNAMFARKFSATIGDGVATSYSVVHNFATRDVHVSVYQAATPFGTVEVDVVRVDLNTVSVQFAVAPAAGAYRVVVS